MAEWAEDAGGGGAGREEGGGLGVREEGFEVVGVGDGFVAEVSHEPAVGGGEVDGGGAAWSREARRAHYTVLPAGAGPFLFAGEHMSYVTGWQEGAVLSAHAAVAKVGG